MPPSFCARSATNASWISCASAMVRGASSAGSGAKRSRRSCESKRCFAAWVNMAARRALALALVESCESRWQVGDDVLHVHLDAVHERPAFRAIPLEAIIDVLRAHLLNHQADRAGGALRRMAAAARGRQ